MAHLPMQKFKKSGQRHQEKGNRFLITVTVLGSTGPLRFIVKEDDLVASVVETALRSYARQGRYPVLGSDFNNFLLYCANAGSEALDPMKPIGSYCCRNFVLCKKQTVENESSGMADAQPRTAVMSRKRVGDSWKAWLNRSLKLKITSH
ncbi:senescence-associated protein [Cinnamomum micranthum f. kanehirae]|uniref:Senescence-associated protein n=1 Tax=Cinnamomum micranthum f. kanehirae TaxID=337451 RepID=A0A443NM97_9MAGN|nr:senescence-associated protein [Cinnamomum micranthum f. kanehirae]